MSKSLVEPTEKCQVNLEDIKAGIMSVRLANRTPAAKEYQKIREEFSDHLVTTGLEMVGDPIAFYKTNDISKQNSKTLAGCVIKVKDKDGNESLMVSYHGTRFNNIQEIRADLRKKQVSCRIAGQDLTLHQGFFEEYQLSKPQLLSAIEEAGLTQGMPVAFSGHSLGGAVAQIAALELQEKRPERKIKVITYGAPRVFSKSSASLYNEKLGSSTLQVRQSRDPVPRIPSRASYSHTGFKLKLETSGLLGHQGTTYRKAASKLSVLDQSESGKKIGRVRPTDFMLRSPETYKKSVMELTKDKFLQLINQTKEKISSLFRSTSKVSHQPARGRKRAENPIIPI